VVTLRRMTARSVVLSVLLGAHPAWASAAELIRLTADFGIKESALRVALTRMVGAGDLIRSADGYRLSDRLLARQRRQDDAVAPRLTDWDGSWVMLVITTVGIDARDRSALRKSLRDSRFGELREGVWLRPDNLAAEPPDDVRAVVRTFRVRDDAPETLVAALWDLDEWAAQARRLLEAMAAAERAGQMAQRFVVAAAMVRHLLTDPVLPPALLPPGWPAAELRRAYTDFADELAARRDPIHQLQEANR
jgi:phenylacetic acid degradation operon negative regulatory protein